MRNLESEIWGMRVGSDSLGPAIRQGRERLYGKRGLENQNSPAFPRIPCVKARLEDGFFWRARDKLKVDDRLRMCKEKRRMGGFYVMLIPLVVGGGVRKPPPMSTGFPLDPHWMSSTGPRGVIPAPMARILPLH